MIIVASQRGGAAKLAAHLMNDRDNDHVKIHKVSGFMADTLPYALQKNHAAPWEHAQSVFFFRQLEPP